MKILILGGVAAGTKVAAKCKRCNRDDEVILITKDEEISYAGCGLPYYIGGVIEDKEELIVNSPSKFAALTNVTVLTKTEAIQVNQQEKKVMVKNLDDQSIQTLDYDKLILATGASAIRLPIEGLDKKGVFTVRKPEDAVNIRDYIEKEKVHRAVIVGGGFIGLELAENLLAKKIQCTVIEATPFILNGIVDNEIANYLKRHLLSKGIRIMTSTSVTAIIGDEKVSAVETSATKVNADLVLVSAGIRPNTQFLSDTSIKMVKGTILVDHHLQTSDKDIYAIGDCAMVTNRITNQLQWSAMGSSANLQGRTLAQILHGLDKQYPGVLGTGIVKLPGINCARTGLSEKQAKDAGFDVVTSVAVTDDKAHYYPDADLFITKLIADRNTHHLLGMQVLGAGAVDKMIDIAVMAINMNARLEDFENADFAYAPPFSTAIHPLVQAAMILLNKINGDLDSMTPAEFEAGKADGYQILDVSITPSIRGARYIDLNKVTGPLDGLNKDEKLLLVCTKGKRGYFLQNRLKHFGYTNILTLEGGLTFNQVSVKTRDTVVPLSEITRVKALGFLHDKRTADKFNGRVITRNGKVTADEFAVISNAAQQFGSGEITMTSRLTLEIQGVPFDNIEPLRQYLAQYGLETGGTGSKVRPVVSCKGTTCQYGLIDTFALSEEIHERFYHGYNDVKLPHKFKIAVGGCPNNCVKPDLNDLGIIGQRVPMIDATKCHGCKVCQVENSCPIKVAHVQNGLITIDDTACNHCGRCIGKCPFKAIETEKVGYRIAIGGRWGKKVAQGQVLDRVFTDKEDVLSIIEKAILLFREQGETGERFADTISRLGFENVQAQLLSDDLLNRKEENLAAQKHLKGGAKC